MVGGAVGGAVDGAAGGAVGGAVGGVFAIAVGGAVGDAVEGAVNGFNGGVIDISCTNCGAVRDASVISALMATSVSIFVVQSAAHSVVWSGASSIIC